ncbi:hypothetical protein VCHC72A2_02721A, partial [Vibrio cholerae HC-72A2]
MSFAPP